MGGGRWLDEVLEFVAVEVHVVAVPCVEAAPGALVGSVVIEDNDGGVHGNIVQLLAGVLGWLESLDVISAGDEACAGGVDDGLGVRIQGEERDLLFVWPQLEWVGRGAGGGAGLWMTQLLPGRGVGRLGREAVAGGGHWPFQLA